MRKRVLYIVAAIAALAQGCEDPPPKPPVTDSPGGPIAGGGLGGAGGGSSGGGTTDGGTTDGGTTDDDAGACTDLPVTGAVVAQQVVNATPPPDAGGELVDGIYDLTNATYYGGPSALPGPSGAEYRGSIRITGQTFERHLVFKNAAGATAETAVRGTFAPTGVNALITLTCPIATQEQVTYTATGNNLVITNIVTNESFGFMKTQ
jgi:hypothetical protein